MPLPLRLPRLLMPLARQGTARAGMAVGITRLARSGGVLALERARPICGRGTSYLQPDASLAISYPQCLQ